MLQSESHGPFHKNIVRFAAWQLNWVLVPEFGNYPHSNRRSISPKASGRSASTFPFGRRETIPELSQLSALAVKPELYRLNEVVWLHHCVNLSLSVLRNNATTHEFFGIAYFVLSGTDPFSAGSKMNHFWPQKHRDHRITLL